MRALLKVGFALLVLAFLLIGLSYSMLRAQGVSGSANPAGRVVESDKRTLGKSVRAIDLDGPIDLTLRQGAVQSLIVRGEQRLLANVETTTGSDGTLHIRPTGMLLFHRQPIEVTLVLPSIEDVSVRGSGESTINGFSGERIAVELSGSGKLKFNGRFRQVRAAINGSGELEMNGGASDKVEVKLVGTGNMTVVGSSKQFKAEQSGTGDIYARHLSADQVDLKLSGTGDAAVTAQKSVHIVLRGAGDVVVYGGPEDRTVDRHGSGEVVFKP
ncbi:head GIN domain-containing protein [Massilia sp. TWR1-2-2]|uniref:head GIN domain-containing protein n=1 Tax=Massilia sp. TWR1-2-2 TaxID=2804584 RepID=UPI003CF86E6D